MDIKFTEVKYRRDLWQVIVGTGNAVEIGVAEGFFSADILSWGRFPIVYMVDRWKTVASQKGDASNSQEWHDENLKAAAARTKSYGESAQILRGDSVQMANYVQDCSLSFCYIDGDHSYDGVTADIYAWLPKLKPHGVMAFHDYENSNYGVKKAVQEFCKDAGYQIYLLPEDKPEDAGAFFIC